ncbi:hypothetical protein FRC20_002874 [Serendipita sp. 405]|nr:hypothetical protein FRC20_002874 [Serendipita sp. 405]
MSGHHRHECHDEHNDGHTHSHDTPLDEVPRETLWGMIDHQNVVALNVVQQQSILKPWENRNDEEIYLESDADDQMIIRIPFTNSSAKLLSILVKAGPGEQTPAKLSLVSASFLRSNPLSNVREFVNEDAMDFEDIDQKEAAQELDIPQSREIGEYQLKYVDLCDYHIHHIFLADLRSSPTSGV